MHPYSLPEKLTPDLARVLAYWEGLKRGAADMPFADDLNLTHLPDMRARLFVLAVFDKPQRFRFEIVGDELARRGGGELPGKFLDEGDLPEPFEFLLSQASATTEARRPTFARKAAGAGASQACGRLLLPMWGEGRLGLLLGAVEWS